MTERRRYLTPSQKADVVQRQKGFCNCGCGEQFRDPREIEYDHIVALWCGGTNALSNWQALIKKHHGEKTSAEAAKRAKADRIAAQDGLKKKKMSQKDRALQEWLEKRA